MLLCNVKCVWLHLKLPGVYETRLMIIQFLLQLSVIFSIKLKIDQFLELNCFPSTLQGIQCRTKFFLFWSQNFQIFWIDLAEVFHILFRLCDEYFFPLGNRSLIIKSRTKATQENIFLIENVSLKRNESF